MISGAVVSSLELSVLIVEIVPSAFTNPVGHTDDGIVLVQLNRNGEDAASAADICHVFISVCFYISVVRTAECDRCISLSVRYSNLAAGDGYLSGSAGEGESVWCVNAVCQCGCTVYFGCAAA